MPKSSLRPSPATLAVLDSLVSFPTVSSESNLALIDWVAAELEARHAKVERLPSSCGGKANLLARLGPDVPGGVVLSGHTDVVPVAGQPWSSDPFELTERNGRVYGRGTCDMKGFLALCLALTPAMDQLKKPIYLALSYDEEVGCLGAPGLIERLASLGARPSAVIVGEPTELKVVTAHKGIAYLKTRVRGHEAHSSLQHLGASAIHAAARLIGWFSDRQTANAAVAVAGPDVPEPPFTTLHCGLIQGGTAPNITAGRCEFTADIRCVAGDDPEQILDAYRAFARTEVEPDLKRVNDAAGIEVEVLANAPPFRAPPDCSAVALARRLTGQNDTSAQPYAAEAGQYSAAGFPTVMCGPGSIEQAHQPDEYIRLEQLAQGEVMLQRLIAELS
ncbi:MAG: acetylornithine deacetylase [Pseudomonadota bacterium]